MVDLANQDAWIPLGVSSAWCWQQGCMLQWRPGSQNEILWNDRLGDRFVTHLLNVETGHRETLSLPIYSVSPDGRYAITPDFGRINDMRPGYGYAGIPDPFAQVLAPAGSGIHRLDLTTGAQTMIIPNQEWILNDTYPDKDRLQTLYLYHTPTEQRIIIAALPTPVEYDGEWRCDLHPRFNPTGQRIIVDSAHAGNGRQMYLVQMGVNTTTEIGPFFHE